MYRIDVYLTDQAVLDAIEELNKTGCPYPLERIAERVRCDRTTVFRAIKSLSRAERLRVIPGRGRGVANRYEVIREPRELPSAVRAG